jgi:enoyl-CoA hydratase/carnithine racemase
MIPSPHENVLLEVDGAIATITLARPEKLNSVTQEMSHALVALIEDADADDEIRVIILTGSGERAFCAGSDIRTLDAYTTPWDFRNRTDYCDAIRAGRKPVIAAINGYAFGGGLELALAADIRVASESATFALPETTIGTLPGWAGTMRLPEAIGVARAKQMIFSGSRIDASTAERWGLVNEVVAVEALMDRCRALASQIAVNAPVSVQLAKAILNGDESAPEAFAGALAAGTEDGREGLAAFREKRLPGFSGR